MHLNKTNGIAPRRALQERAVALSRQPNARALSSELGGESPKSWKRNHTIHSEREMEHELMMEVV